MGLLVLLVVVTLVILSVRMASLGRRLDQAERERRERLNQEDRVEALARRVYALEKAVRPPAIPLLVASVVREPARPHAATAGREARPAEVASSPESVAPRAVQRPAPASQSPATAAVPSVIDSAPTPAPDASSASAWEIVVGANWLNRIGVAALVIGVALGVGYTVGHAGPLGRISIGYATSLLLLGGGALLERRPTYRSYAYGLVAGGWAGTYFTTYAAHGLAAARVIDSDVAATAALAAVAAGMVAHSLRYRSQTVTGLAYVIAYATLGLTPLSGFALVASVPLSASLLIVAERFEWAHVATLGVVSTYGVFILRGTILPGQIDPASLSSLLALAAYWLTFEVGDIASLWNRPRAAAEPAPLFVLNALGFTGAAAIQFPLDSAGRFSTLLGAAAAAYLVSAVVRARVLRRIATADAGFAAAFSGASQGAIGAAAALTMWAVSVRFSGARELGGLLLVAEMLFVAGVMFGDRIVRGFGAAAATIAWLDAYALVITRAAAPPDWLWSLHAFAPVVAVTVVAFYVNREVLRARRLAPLAFERGYTFAAAVLVLYLVYAEFPHAYQGLALMVAAFLLTEAGVRRGAEYRYQAYALGALGTVLLVGFQVSAALGAIGDVTVADAWRTLPAAIVLAYAIAARLAQRARTAPEGLELRAGAAGAATIGAGLVMLLEWRAGPEVLIAPLWAATALILVGAGAARRLPLPVSQGYVLLLVATMRAMRPIVELPVREADAQTVMWAGVVIAALVAAGLVGRRSVRGRSGMAADVEDAIRLVVLGAVPIALVAMIFREVDSSAVTLALGVAGVLLVGLGLGFGERMLRLSGLAVFALGILRLFVNDLVSLTGLTRVVSFVLSGLVLLAVSWAYTRFRDRIRRYL